MRGERSRNRLQAAASAVADLALARDEERQRGARCSERLLPRESGIAPLSESCRVTPSHFCGEVATSSARSVQFLRVASRRDLGPSRSQADAERASRRCWSPDRGRDLLRTRRHGYAVLLPFGVNPRYDLVIDIEGRFVRAQCKTGRLRRGVVEFRTRSVRSNTVRTIMRGYEGEADIFLVHCRDTGRIYSVPVDEAPHGQMCLRVVPTVNGQARGVHWATDYELPG